MMKLHNSIYGELLREVATDIASEVSDSVYKQMFRESKQKHDKSIERISALLKEQEMKRKATKTWLNRMIKREDP